MKTKRTYLFVLDNLEAGGIQRQLLEVCRSLRNKGDDCSVACFRRQGDMMSGEFKEADIEVIFLGKKHLIDFGFLFRLRKMLKRKYDLVHSMTPQASFWISLTLSFFSPTLFVGSLLNVHKFNKPVERWCEKFLPAKRMKAVFVNAEAVKEHYRKNIPGAPEIWKIYNGVRTDNAGNRESIRKKLGISAEEIAVVCVGRLEPVKRHIDAVHALSKRKRQHPDVKLYILGEGPLERDLKELVLREDLEERVLFTGYIKNPQSLLPGFDIFLLPSESEGFPNALLEAMAAGLPCIATNTGGTPEAITDGESGILIPPRCPEEISASMKKLADNPELRKRLGAAARERTEKMFSMDRMLKLITGKYEKLIRENRYDASYIMSQFPKISEAFILREIVEMRKRGIRFCVVSLKPARENIVHEESRNIIKDAFYLPWFNLRILFYNLYAFLTMPIQYAKTLCEFLRIHLKYPSELIKAAAIWWKTVSFALILRQYRLKHVHANWATIPTACGLAISTLLGTTFSFTAHAFDIYGKPTALPEKIAKAEFVSTCTQRNVEHLRSLAAQNDRDKIHLIRHFLSRPASLKKEKQLPPVIISVGSLEYYKGHDVLIRAAGILKERGVRFQLRIIGGGPLERELRSLAQKLGVSDETDFTGKVEQKRVFTELAGAHVFALASRRCKSGEDNLPNVLVEASLLKVPCIATRVGSIKEFIEHEKTGLLAEPENADQLAGFLGKLLREENTGERLAEGAKTRAEQMFSVEKNAPALEELFRKVIIDTNLGNRESVKRS